LAYRPVYYEEREIRDPKTGELIRMGLFPIKENCGPVNGGTGATWHRLQVQTFNGRVI